MRDYKPSNKISGLGLLLLPIATLIGGLLIGAVVYFVSNLIYLIIFFPIIMGGLGSAVMWLAVDSGKVRSPIIAAFFGVLIALLLYGTYHYLDYTMGFRGDLREEAETVLGETVTDEQLQLLEDEILREATDSTGLVGYLKLTAEEGITITSTRNPSSDGPTLRNTGVYIYWLVEIVIITMIAVGIAYSKASEPYSEEVDEWFGKPDYVGSMRPDVVSQFIGALDQYNFAKAGSFLTVEAKRSPVRTEIIAQQTSTASSEVVVVLRNVATDKRGNERTKKIFTRMLGISEFNTMKEARSGHQA